MFLVETKLSQNEIKFIIDNIITLINQKQQKSLNDQQAIQALRSNNLKLTCSVLYSIRNDKFAESRVVIKGESDEIRMVLYQSNCNYSQNQEVFVRYRSESVFYFCPRSANKTNEEQPRLSFLQDLSKAKLATTRVGLFEFLKMLSDPSDAIDFLITRTIYPLLRLIG